MKKLIFLIGLVFLASCASGSNFADPYTTTGSLNPPDSGRNIPYADPYSAN